MGTFLTSNEEKHQLMKSFKNLDTNGDGVISREELKAGYSKYIGSSKDIDKQIDAILSSVDKNKSGFIDYTEFVISSMRMENSLSDAKIDKAFRLLDVDGNGRLSIQELKTMLGDNIPSTYYQQLVKQFDENGDGEISKEEFTSMMKKILLRSL